MTFPGNSRYQNHALHGSLQRIAKLSDDARGKHHVMRSSRPSPSLFTGGQRSRNNYTLEGESLEIEAKGACC